MVAIAKIQAGILSSQLAIYQVVLDVIGEGVVGNLIVILAQRGHEAQLVGGIDIENEGAEAAVAIFRVVNHLQNRRLDAEIAAVGVDAGIVGEAFGVTAEAEGVVGLVEIPGAEHELGLAVALEAGARDHVKDSISAVTELRAVAPAIDFEIVDVLGIELRPQVGGDVGVGYGYAVGDHGETVGAGGAGSAFDIEAADQRGGSGGVRGNGLGSPGDIDGLFGGP